eukprot:TRINITY_DN66693_c0_g1_i1.p1 TRINITY_DN66693_c0_g1~~TRINITY_DN66693_c0_g1_i1.p1  ORF type:complete len:330 (-),score=57.37 TRINITY_DN66693_c0_g1_i1:264-1208(-)
MASHQPTLRAICSHCRRPLCGSIVVSRCNHVFHRECLSDPNATCKKCGASGLGENSLDLYGVEFNDRLIITRRSSSASVNQGVVDLDDDDDGDDENALMELVMLRDRVQQLRQSLADAQEKKAAVDSEVERQAKRCALAEKIVAKQETERNAAAADVEKWEHKYTELLEQIQRGRQRDAAIEYREMLKGGKADADALAFLTKTLSFHPDPAQLLTEIRRLRDHHREKVQRLQRRVHALNQDNARLRRELDDKQRRVESTKRKLQRKQSNSKVPASQDSVMRSSSSASALASQESLEESASLSRKRSIEAVSPAV